MRNRKILYKTISIVTLICFISTNVQAAPQSASVNPPAAVTPSLSLNNLTIPEELGHIHDLQNFGGSRNVILIQDAHCNYEGQVNIQKTLDLLQAQYGLKLITFEGGKGPMDLLALKTFPIDSVKKYVMKKYAVRGEISGVEMAGVLNKHEARYVAVEDMDLYHANRQAFLDVEAQRQVLDATFEELYDSLIEIREEVYNAQLMEIDQNVDDQEEDLLPLTTLFLYVVDKAEEYGVSLAKYANLSSLIYHFQLERDLEENTGKLYAAANEFIGDVKEVLPEQLDLDEVMEFGGQYQAYSIEEIAKKDFLKYLFPVTERVGLHLKDQSFLERHVVGSKDIDEIQSVDFFKELRELVWEVKQHMFETDDQRSFDHLYRNFKILRDLSRLELSKEALEYYQSHRKEFDAQVYALFLAKFGKGPINYDMSLAERFYRAAVMRDGELYKNLTRTMKKQGENNAVLVTGGFHTEGLKERFEQNGISYAIITPHIGYLDFREVYVRVMRDDVSYLSNPEEKNRLRRNIFQSDPRLAMKNLKQWRAAIINEALVKGKIADTERYTRHVDHLMQTIAGGVARAALAPELASVGPHREAFLDAASESLLERSLGETVRGALSVGDLANALESSAADIVGQDTIDLTRLTRGRRIESRLKLIDEVKTEVLRDVGFLASSYSVLQGLYNRGRLGFERFRSLYIDRKAERDSLEGGELADAVGDRGGNQGFFFAEIEQIHRLITASSLGEARTRFDALEADNQNLGEAQATALAEVSKRLQVEEVLANLDQRDQTEISQLEAEFNQPVSIDLRLKRWWVGLPFMGKVVVVVTGITLASALVGFGLSLVGVTSIAGMTTALGAKITALFALGGGGTTTMASAIPVGTSAPRTPTSLGDIFLPTDRGLSATELKRRRTIYLAFLKYLKAERHTTGSRVSLGTASLEDVEEALIDLQGLLPDKFATPEMDAIIKQIITEAEELAGKELIAAYRKTREDMEKGEPPAARAPPVRLDAQQQNALNERIAEVQALINDGRSKTIDLTDEQIEILEWELAYLQLINSSPEISSELLLDFTTALENKQADSSGRVKDSLGASRILAANFRLNEDAIQSLKNRYQRLQTRAYLLTRSGKVVDAKTKLELEALRNLFFGERSLDLFDANLAVFVERFEELSEQLNASSNWLFKREKAQKNLKGLMEAFLEGNLTVEQAQKRLNVLQGKHTNLIADALTAKAQTVRDRILEMQADLSKGRKKLRQALRALKAQRRKAAKDSSIDVDKLDGLQAALAQEEAKLEKLKNRKKRAQALLAQLDKALERDFWSFIFMRSGNVRQARRLLAQLQTDLNLLDSESRNAKLEERAEALQELASKYGETNPTDLLEDVRTNLESGTVTFKNIEDVIAFQTDLVAIRGNNPAEVNLARSEYEALGRVAGIGSALRAAGRIGPTAKAEIKESPEEKDMRESTAEIRGDHGVDHAGYLKQLYGDEFDADVMADLFSNVDQGDYAAALAAFNALDAGLQDAKVREYLQLLNDLAPHLETGDYTAALAEFDALDPAMKALPVYLLIQTLEKVMPHLKSGDYVAAEAEFELLPVRAKKLPIYGLISGIVKNGANQNEIVKLFEDLQKLREADASSMKTDAELDAHKKKVEKFLTALKIQASGWKGDVKVRQIMRKIISDIEKDMETGPSGIKGIVNRLLGQAKTDSTGALLGSSESFSKFDNVQGLLEMMLATGRIRLYTSASFLNTYFGVLDEVSAVDQKDTKAAMQAFQLDLSRRAGKASVEAEGMRAELQPFLDTQFEARKTELDALEQSIFRATGDENALKDLHRQRAEIFKEIKEAAFVKMREINGDKAPSREQIFAYGEMMFEGFSRIYDDAGWNPTLRDLQRQYINAAFEDKISLLSTSAGKTIAHVYILGIHGAYAKEHNLPFSGTIIAENERGNANYTSETSMIAAGLSHPELAAFFGLDIVDGVELMKKHDREGLEAAHRDGKILLMDVTQAGFYSLEQGDRESLRQASMRTTHFAVDEIDAVSRNGQRFIRAGEDPELGKLIRDITPEAMIVSEVLDDLLQSDLIEKGVDPETLQERNGWIQTLLPELKEQAKDQVLKEIAKEQGIDKSAVEKILDKGKDNGYSLRQDHIKMRIQGVLDHLLMAKMSVELHYDHVELRHEAEAEVVNEVATRLAGSGATVEQTNALKESLQDLYNLAPNTVVKGIERDELVALIRKRYETKVEKAKAKLEAPREKQSAFAVGYFEQGSGQFNSVTEEVTEAYLMYMLRERLHAVLVARGVILDSKVTPEMKGEERRKLILAEIETIKIESGEHKGDPLYGEGYLKYATSSAMRAFISRHEMDYTDKGIKAKPVEGGGISDADFSNPVYALILLKRINRDRAKFIESQLPAKLGETATLKIKINDRQWEMDEIENRFTLDNYENTYETVDDSGKRNVGFNIHFDRQSKRLQDLKAKGSEVSEKEQQEMQKIAGELQELQEKIKELEWEQNRAKLEVAYGRKIEAYNATLAAFRAETDPALKAGLRQEVRRLYGDLIAAGNALQEAVTIDLDEAEVNYTTAQTTLIAWMNDANRERFRTRSKLIENLNTLEAHGDVALEVFDIADHANSQQFRVSTVKSDGVRGLQIERVADGGKYFVPEKSMGAIATDERIVLDAFGMELVKTADGFGLQHRSVSITGGTGTGGLAILTMQGTFGADEVLSFDESLYFYDQFPASAVAQVDGADYRLIYEEREGIFVEVDGLAIPIEIELNDKDGFTGPFVKVSGDYTLIPYGTRLVDGEITLSDGRVIEVDLNSNRRKIVTSSQDESVIPVNTLIDDGELSTIKGDKIPLDLRGSYDAVSSQTIFEELREAFSPTSGVLVLKAHKDTAGRTIPARKIKVEVEQKQEVVVDKGKSKTVDYQLVTSSSDESLIPSGTRINDKGEVEFFDGSKLKGEVQFDSAAYQGGGYLASLENPEAYYDQLVDLMVKTNRDFTGEGTVRVDGAEIKLGLEAKVAADGTNYYEVTKSKNIKIVPLGAEIRAGKVTLKDGRVVSLNLKAQAVFTMFTRTKDLAEARKRLETEYKIIDAHEYNEDIDRIIRDGVDGQPVVFVIDSKTDPDLINKIAHGANKGGHMILSYNQQIATGTDFSKEVVEIVFGAEELDLNTLLQLKGRTGRSDKLTARIFFFFEERFDRRLSELSIEKDEVMREVRKALSVDQSGKSSNIFAKILANVEAGREPFSNLTLTEKTYLLGQLRLASQLSQNAQQKGGEFVQKIAVLDYAAESIREQGGKDQNGDPVTAAGKAIQKVYSRYLNKPAGREGSVDLLYHAGEVALGKDRLKGSLLRTLQEAQEFHDQLIDEFEKDAAISGKTKRALIERSNAKLEEIRITRKNIEEGELALDRKTINLETKNGALEVAVSVSREWRTGEYTIIQVHNMAELETLLQGAIILNDRKGTVVREISGKRELVGARLKKAENLVRVSTIKEAVQSVMFHFGEQVLSQKAELPDRSGMQQVVQKREAVQSSVISVDAQRIESGVGLETRTAESITTRVEARRDVPETQPLEYAHVRQAAVDFVNEILDSQETLSVDGTSVDVSLRLVNTPVGARLQVIKSSDLAIVPIGAVIAPDGNVEHPSMTTSVADTSRENLEKKHKKSQFQLAEIAEFSVGFINEFTGTLSAQGEAFQKLVKRLSKLSDAQREMIRERLDPVLLPVSEWDLKDSAGFTLALAWSLYGRGMVDLEKFEDKHIDRLVGLVSALEEQNFTINKKKMADVEDYVEAIMQLRLQVKEVLRASRSDEEIKIITSAYANGEVLVYNRETGRSGVPSEKIGAGSGQRNITARVASLGTDGLSPQLKLPDSLSAAVRESSVIGQHAFKIGLIGGSIGALLAGIFISWPIALSFVGAVAISTRLATKQNGFLRNNSLPLGLSLAGISLTIGIIGLIGLVPFSFPFVLMALGVSSLLTVAGAHWDTPFIGRPIYRFIAGLSKFGWFSKMTGIDSRFALAVRLRLQREALKQVEEKKEAVYRDQRVLREKYKQNYRRFESREFREQTGFWGKFKQRAEKWLLFNLNFLRMPTALNRNPFHLRPYYLFKNGLSKWRLQRKQNMLEQPFTGLRLRDLRSLVQGVQDERREDAEAAMITDAELAMLIIDQLFPNISKEQRENIATVLETSVLTSTPNAKLDKQDIAVLPELTKQIHENPVLGSPDALQDTAGNDLFAEDQLNQVALDQAIRAAQKSTLSSWFYRTAICLWSNLPFFGASVLFSATLVGVQGAIFAVLGFTPLGWGLIAFSFFSFALMGSISKIINDRVDKPMLGMGALYSMFGWIDALVQRVGFLKTLSSRYTKTYLQQRLSEFTSEGATSQATMKVAQAPEVQLALNLALASLQRTDLSKAERQSIYESIIRPLDQALEAERKAAQAEVGEKKTQEELRKVAEGKRAEAIHKIENFSEIAPIQQVLQAKQALNKRYDAAMQKKNMDLAKLAREKETDIGVLREKMSEKAKDAKERYVSRAHLKQVEANTGVSFDAVLRLFNPRYAKALRKLSIIKSRKAHPIVNLAEFKALLEEAKLEGAERVEYLLSLETGLTVNFLVKPQVLMDQLSAADPIFLNQLVLEDLTRFSSGDSRVVARIMRMTNAYKQLAPELWQLIQDGSKTSLVLTVEQMRAVLLALALHTVDAGKIYRKFQHEDFKKHKNSKKQSVADRLVWADEQLQLARAVVKDGKTDEARTYYRAASLGFTEAMNIIENQAVLRSKYREDTALLHLLKGRAYYEWYQLTGNPSIGRLARTEFRAAGDGQFSLKGVADTLERAANRNLPAEVDLAEDTSDPLFDRTGKNRKHDMHDSLLTPTEREVLQTIRDLAEKPFQNAYRRARTIRKEEAGNDAWEYVDFSIRVDAMGDLKAILQGMDALPGDKAEVRRAKRRAKHRNLLKLAYVVLERAKDKDAPAEITDLANVIKSSPVGTLINEAHVLNNSRSLEAMDEALNDKATAFTQADANALRDAIVKGKSDLHKTLKELIIERTFTYQFELMSPQDREAEGRNTMQASPLRGSNVKRVFVYLHYLRNLAANRVLKSTELNSIINQEILSVLHEEVKHQIPGEDMDFWAQIFQSIIAARRKGTESEKNYANAVIAVAEAIHYKEELDGHSYAPLDTEADNPSVALVAYLKSKGIKVKALDWGKFKEDVNNIRKGIGLLKELYDRDSLKRLEAELDARGKQAKDIDFMEGFAHARRDFDDLKNLAKNIAAEVAYVFIFNADRVADFDEKTTREFFTNYFEGERYQWWWINDMKDPNNPGRTYVKDGKTIVEPGRTIFEAIVEEGVEMVKRYGPEYEARLDAKEATAPVVTRVRAEVAAKNYARAVEIFETDLTTEQQELVFAGDYHLVRDAYIGAAKELAEAGKMTEARALYQRLTDLLDTVGVAYQSFDELMRAGAVEGYIEGAKDGDKVIGAAKQAKAQALYDNLKTDPELEDPTAVEADLSDAAALDLIISPKAKEADYKVAKDIAPGSVKAETIAAFKKNAEAAVKKIQYMVEGGDVDGALRELAELNAVDAGYIRSNYGNIALLLNQAKRLADDGLDDLRKGAESGLVVDRIVAFARDDLTAVVEAAASSEANSFAASVVQGLFERFLVEGDGDAALRPVVVKTTALAAKLNESENVEERLVGRVAFRSLYVDRATDPTIKDILGESLDLKEAQRTARAVRVSERTVLIAGNSDEARRFRTAAKIAESSKMDLEAIGGQYVNSEYFATYLEFAAGTVSGEAIAQAFGSLSPAQEEAIRRDAIAGAALIVQALNIQPAETGEITGDGRVIKVQTIPRFSAEEEAREEIRALPEEQKRALLEQKQRAFIKAGIPNLVHEAGHDFFYNELTDVERAEITARVKSLPAFPELARILIGTGDYAKFKTLFPAEYGIDPATVVLSAAERVFLEQDLTSEILSYTLQEVDGYIDAFRVESAEAVTAIQSILSEYGFDAINEYVKANEGIVGRSLEVVLRERADEKSVTNYSPEALDVLIERLFSETDLVEDPEALLDAAGGLSLAEVGVGVHAAAYHIEGLPRNFILKQVEHGQEAVVLAAYDFARERDVTDAIARHDRPIEVNGRLFVLQEEGAENVKERLTRLILSGDRDDLEAAKIVLREGVLRHVNRLAADEVVYTNSRSSGGLLDDMGFMNASDIAVVNFDFPNLGLLNETVKGARVEDVIDRLRYDVANLIATLGLPEDRETLVRRELLEALVPEVAEVGVGEDEIIPDMTAKIELGAESVLLIPLEEKRAAAELALAAARSKGVDVEEAELAVVQAEANYFAESYRLVARREVELTGRDEVDRPRRADQAGQIIQARKLLTDAETVERDRLTALGRPLVESRQIAINAELALREASSLGAATMASPSELTPVAGLPAFATVEDVTEGTKTAAIDLADRGDGLEEGVDLSGTPIDADRASAELADKSDLSIIDIDAGSSLGVAQLESLARLTAQFLALELDVNPELRRIVETELAQAGDSIFDLANLRQFVTRLRDRFALASGVVLPLSRQQNQNAQAVSVALDNGEVETLPQSVIESISVAAFDSVYTSPAEIFGLSVELGTEFESRLVETLRQRGFVEGVEDVDFNQPLTGSVQQAVVDTLNQLISERTGIDGLLLNDRGVVRVENAARLIGFSAELQTRFETLVAERSRAFDQTLSVTDVARQLIGIQIDTLNELVREESGVGPVFEVRDGLPLRIDVAGVSGLRIDYLDRYKAFLMNEMQRARSRIFLAEGSARALTLVEQVEAEVSAFNQILRESGRSGALLEVQAGIVHQVDIIDSAEARAFYNLIGGFVSEKYDIPLQVQPVNGEAALAFFLELQDTQQRERVLNALKDFLIERLERERRALLAEQAVVGFEFEDVAQRLLLDSFSRGPLEELISGLNADVSPAELDHFVLAIEKILHESAISVGSNEQETQRASQILQELEIENGEIAQAFERLIAEWGYPLNFMAEDFIDTELKGNLGLAVHIDSLPIEFDEAFVHALITSLGAEGRLFLLSVVDTQGALRAARFMSLLSTPEMQQVVPMTYVRGTLPPVKKVLSKMQRMLKRGVPMAMILPNMRVLGSELQGLSREGLYLYELLSKEIPAVFAKMALSLALSSSLLDQIPDAHFSQEESLANGEAAFYSFNLVAIARELGEEVKSIRAALVAA